MDEREREARRLREEETHKKGGKGGEEKGDIRLEE